MPIRIQRFVAVFSVVFFLIKMGAWMLTNSVAILTDALESIVNVITGLVGLYSVNLAAKPRDMDHPFGHGKVEFLSAALEGVLIFIAGGLIGFKAIEQLFHPPALQQLSWGILITALTGVANLVTGFYVSKNGILHKSATLHAAGRHLKADGYSSLTIVTGLLLLFVTHWQWVDSAVALVFTVVILFTGYKVLRSSLAGIMDEADSKLLTEVIHFLQKNRKPSWIDVHNMRVLQYGNVLHADAHMTLPWYWNVSDGEREIHVVEELIKQHYGGSIEIFIHIDACAPFSCKLCGLDDCPVRVQPFEKLLVWTPENVWLDSKHGKQ